MQDNNITKILYEQFASECEVIDLNKEYPGYTGHEKYGIITALSETELARKYEIFLSELTPYIVLDLDFGKTRKEYRRNDEKNRWRRRVWGLFPIDDDFDEHHPECCSDPSEAQSNLKMLLDDALSQLPGEQSRRIRNYYLQGFTLQEIAESEHVSKSAVYYSIQKGLKNLKKILTQT